jgi:hypothetical protein
MSIVHIHEGVFMSVVPSPRLALAPDHLQRIGRISRWMVQACWALVVCLPLAWLWYWVSTAAPELAVQANLSAGTIQLPLQVWQRVAAAAVNAVPLALLLVGVWQAKHCFAHFAQGQVFTAQATEGLRRFAGWVAAAALAAIVAGAGTSVLLTLHNAPGTRQLAIGLSSNHVFTLFFAAVVWLMADIIGQGQVLAEENERFV